MTVFLKNIFVLTFVFINVDKFFGQHFMRNDTFPYYEYSGSGNYLKVTKITDGQHTFYSKDGSRTISGKFKNGQRVSFSAYIFDENGTLMRIAEYKDGIYIGDREIKQDSAFANIKNKAVFVDLTKQKGSLAFKAIENYSIYDIYGINILSGKSGKINFYKLLPLGQYWVKHGDKCFEVKTK